MATQPAEQQSANPIVVIRQNLSALAPEFKAALPAHVSVEKFSRVAMTAIQNNPDLQRADRRSLFGAIVRLAQDGLLPDGREAALVLFGNKAQAMPMIAGVLKKIRQSGEVAKVSSHVVYANDHFMVKYGFDEDVEHVPPALNEPRGEPIGAYATAVLKDGSQLLEVMSLEQIEKVRAVSRAKNNGPWVAWWEEMARKTVMRRLSKRLPMSTDLEDEIFSRDETMAPGHEMKAANEQRLEPSPAPASRLDAIEHQIGAVENTDAITGEVIESQADEVEAEITTAGTLAGEAGPDAEDERESGPATDDEQDEREQPDEVNDRGATLLDAVDQQPAPSAGADPAAAKANEIIDGIKAATSIAEVTATWGRNAGHIQAMDEGLRSTVVTVKEARLAELQAEPTAEAAR
jgi:recombination protein RecT